jgi:glycosyltransferase involved in cell wall biosynthesis
VFRPRVLIVHTFYQQPGGEDQVFAAEKTMLEAAGCEVLTFTAHNEAMEGMGRLEQLQSTLWSRDYYQKIRAFIREHRPQVMHVHNTFPLMSPSIFHAAKAEGVPIVMTLHNFRLFCANYNFYRDGKPCTDCLKQFFPISAIQHSCYRDSKAASAVVASMIGLHKLLGSWSGKVDRLIALTEFARDTVLQGGLPAEKLVVKPNFLQDPGAGQGGGGYALFVGRLSPEKGIGLMLEAWKNLPHPLKIVGDGPEVETVRKAGIPQVEFLGRQPREIVLELMKKAEFLVFPSQWFEGFPMTIVESYAVGLPIVATNLGSMASLIRHGETGLHFGLGDAADLARQARVMFENPAMVAEMRKKARLEYEAHYTAEKNLEQLLGIYQSVVNP